MNLLQNNFQPNNWVSGEMAMDLGTANTLIWVKSKGVIINEPSIIARNINNGKVIAVGEEASAMVGKTHRDIETIFPGSSNREVQRYNITGNDPTGAYRLIFGGQTSDCIYANASESFVKMKLDALSSISISRRQDSCE